MTFLGLVMMLFPRCWLDPFSIPVWMFVLWSIMPVRRFSSVLLQGTFLIFVAHMMVLKLFEIVFKRTDMPIPVAHILSWAGSICFILLMNYLLRRKFPRAMSILCGGR